MLLCDSLPLSFMPIVLPRVRAQKLRSKKKRTQASASWLLRQINDPYCQAARRDAYRSRAAYKLIEINTKFPFLRSGMSVIDLGAAPGSWSQVVKEQIKMGCVLALDRLGIDPIEGVHIIQADFLLEEEKLLGAMQTLKLEAVDVVLSDMAPETTGQREVDHLRIVALNEEAVDFALKYLKKGGHFLTKVWQGGMQGPLLVQLKQHFTSVIHVKPQASRSRSPEQYLLARNKK